MSWGSDIESPTERKRNLAAEKPLGDAEAPYALSDPLERPMAPAPYEGAPT
jgi:hypothetical protein